MKSLPRIPAYIKNKFFLTAAAFVLWMLFFDRNDLLTQAERRRELKELQASKQYYKEQITIERKTSEELKSDPAVIEKYAREKYLMKRDNEDLFIIQDLQKQ
ncbi:MAG TPA: septum formation initiator family protein [Chitinophagaceae bacterium]|jgi:cell division protein FtsB|nr:septum formation initiator family protein [Chitinophagaceae bacterium]